MDAGDICAHAGVFVLFARVVSCRDCHIRVKCLCRTSLWHEAITEPGALVIAPFVLLVCSLSVLRCCCCCTAACARAL
jgi:hypothetical protein